MKLLLEAKANVEAADNDGRNPSPVGKEVVKERDREEFGCRILTDDWIYGYEEQLNQRIVERDKQIARWSSSVLYLFHTCHAFIGARCLV